MRILQTPSTFNNATRYSVVNKQINQYNNISFGNTGTEQKSKFFDSIKKILKPISDPCKKAQNKLTDFIARRIASILNIESVTKFVNRVKNSNNLVAHCTAITSIILSGFYIQQTLENEKLDPDRKKTLAINQGATTILSTFISYTLDKITKNNVDKFAKKFEKFNENLETKANIERYKKGIGNAASIMIFMTIHRFIAPVLVTPLANHIGNKLQEQQESEIEGKK